ncbi:DUF1598 domain-containing protein [Calycomorphotria hydatis]|uniref:DUF1598 domain-containing protein n=1 Tax=Calycomorphotria hydatis TaxID=2528027 RepID=A0A517TAL4_9PLAN|nr:DUF1598 domain-containing protein [Calycomorphotria hydatis]QDT65406.1 hypothetical protein V22_26590 [Calycomorphotria hydatis]
MSRKLRRPYFNFAFLLSFVFLLSPLGPALGQDNGGGDNGNGGNGDTQDSGITIDTDGFVRTVTNSKVIPRLDQRRAIAYLNSELPGSLHDQSEKRYISLRRLEEACERQLAEGKSLPLEMKFFAGLTQIDEIFFFPEENDIVICGPAEPFAPDTSGRITSLMSGRSPLRLEDFVIALNGVKQSRKIGCSIDPFPEKLVALQRWLNANSRPTSRSAAMRKYDTMAKVLGPQKVTVNGIPDDTRFASVLIEADYLMKQISIGLTPSGVRQVTSHLAMIRPGGNAMQRWWFVPDYESLTSNAEGNAFALDGSRLKLLSEQQLANAQGKRFSSDAKIEATARFSEQFTEHMDKLVQVHRSFAELQNLIDLIVLASLIQSPETNTNLAWQPGLLGDLDRYPVVHGNSPKLIASTANAKSVGNTSVLGLVAGGVEIYPRQLLQQFRTGENDAELNRLRLAAQPGEENWWWDQK